MERQAKDGTFYEQIAKDEWRPITRVAKDGTTYKKVGADQWAPAEQAPEKELGLLEKLDSYTGAPTRAAIGAAQDGKNPLSAFTGAWGEDPAKAPTGRQIMTKAGVSDEQTKGLTAQQQMEFDKKNQPGLYAQNIKNPNYYQDKGPGLSDAQVLGAGVDAVADWTNAALPAAGLVGKALSKGAPIAKEALAAAKSATTARMAQKAEAGAEAAAKVAAEVKGGGLSVEQGGKLFDVKAPQSLEELRTWKPEANAGELVGKSRLQQIEKSVPDLQTKPLKYHYDMMENPKAMKELKLKFENLPTKDAKQIAAYNLGMVNESASKIKNTVAELAGGEARSLGDAGNEFIDAAKTRYTSEREALGPMFEQIQSRASQMNQTAGRDLIQGIGANSKLGQLIKEDVKTGRLALSKNTPRTGLSDSEHSMLARVIDDLNDGMSFKEVQDTREFLRKAIDPANPGASSEIQKVRSILLGQLESMAGKLGDDVGKTFKAYAVNERSREGVEKIIGGSIDSLDKMFAANPEKVVQKIFSNPNYTKVVSDYVGPEQMKRMSAAYIQQGIDKATDSAKGFSPEKFRTWLKSNGTFLKANVDPKTAERLNALADYGYFGKRFLDEVNPSGTAASILNGLEAKSFMQKIRQDGITSTIIGEVGSRANAAVNQRSAIRSVNEAMGAPKKPGLIDKINDIKVPDVGLKGKAVNAQRASVGSRFLKPSEASAVAEEKDRGPAPKGPEKWAADGVAKLDGAVDAELLAIAAKDPQGKRLLMEASDLKPGSKAMNALAARIKQKFGKGS